MANPQNLKPWPKGTSGNPAGRPRRDKLIAAFDAVNDLLVTPDPRDKAGRTHAQVIAGDLVRKAVRGDVRAAREIALLTEGRPLPRPRRDKLTPLIDAMNDLLVTPDPRDKAGWTYAEVIAAAMVRKAVRGDVRAAKEIALRTEGRPSKVPLKWDEDDE